MRMRSLAILTTLCSTLVAVGQEAPLILTIQVRPGASAKTLATIAKLGVANEIVTSEKATLKSVLSEEYGSSHERFRKLFAAYNPGVKKELVRAGTHLTLPAAPIWIFDVPKQVSSTVDALDLAKLEMGVAGPKTKKNIAQTNNTSWSSLVSSSELRTVTLPYVAPFVSVEIKPEYRAAAAKIIRALMASDPSVQVAEIGEPYRLIGSLASSPSLGAAGTNRGFVRPMPTDKYLSALPKSRSTLAILDSGIAQGDPRFDDLWKNPRLAEDGHDLDFDYLRDDVNGFDFVNYRAFPQDDVANHHGTHVSGIATQRLADSALRSAVNDRLDLMVLKVADANGWVYQAAVDNAVSFAVERGVRVVNMSFAGRPSVNLQMTFAKARNVLFVVAAGNESIDADTNDVAVYPAKFAAKLPNVLSVAASDSETIASNSNYGARSIDIAAPGVDVESTIAGGTAKLSGSSQAAPLVAYVASLLASSGFSTPASIRQRIIDSADVLPSLHTKISSEGVLDPEKALSYSTDLVELSDHSLLRGTLRSPAQLLMPNGKILGMSDVRKIVFGYSSDPAKELRVTWIENGARAVAAIGREFDEVILNHDGVDEKIPANKIRDVVRASVP
jgi:hypothetical protein